MSRIPPLTPNNHNYAIPDAAADHRNSRTSRSSYPATTLESPRSTLDGVSPARRHSADRARILGATSTVATDASDHPDLPRAPNPLSDAVKAIFPDRAAAWSKFAGEENASSYTQLLTKFKTDLGSLGPSHPCRLQHTAALEWGMERMENNASLRAEVFAETAIVAEKCIDNRLNGIFNQNVLVARSELEQKKLPLKELYQEAIKFAWVNEAQLAIARFAKQHNVPGESLEYFHALISDEAMDGHLPTEAIAAYHQTSFQLPKRSEPGKEDSFVDQFKTHMLSLEQSGGLRRSLSNCKPWRESLQRDYAEAYSEQVLQVRFEEIVAEHCNDLGTKDLPVLKEKRDELLLLVMDESADAGESKAFDDVHQTIIHIEGVMEKSREWAMERIHQEQTDRYLKEIGIDPKPSGDIQEFDYHAPANMTFQGQFSLWGFGGMVSFPHGPLHADTLEPTTGGRPLTQESVMRSLREGRGLADGPQLI